MFDFETLEFWKKSHQLTVQIYKITRNFPIDERFGMISHIRRTVFSIPSNIAEGCGRNGKRELFNFFNIAAGSCSELNYQLRLANELGYIEDSDYKELKLEVIETQKMICSYMKTLNSKL